IGALASNYRACKERPSGLCLSEFGCNPFPLCFRFIRRIAVMPKSLAKIEQQIKALEREAAQLRKKEAAGVVARIKEAIAYYDLSAQDLGLGSEPPGRRGAAARGSRRVRSEPRVR